MTWNVLDNPIDPGQLTEMPFGDHSYWLQPWRSSLTTQPATLLQDAIGINIDNRVSPAEAPATLRLLHDSGFRRARLEIGWGAMSYEDPSLPANPAQWVPYLTAMRDNGIRPLILLNANDGGPVPLKTLELTLTAPAARGATSVSLDAASAAQVVPGLTGIDAGSVVAQVLITSVNAGGVATLSQPLPASLSAGPVAAATLRFAPFAPPYLASGTPNPRFQQTLTGWLTYVKGVTQFVRTIYGSDNFDVEVWNELTFGSDFLDESHYFSPVPDPGSTGDVDNALLQATIQLLHDPANGLTDVKVGDGFANQTPFASGANVPPGTDAIDKHPYEGTVNVYPGSPHEATAPLDALGAHGAWDNATGTFQSLFTPTFRVFMPEYYLTGIATETLMRNLSPIQTLVYGTTAYGAATHPVGSAPPATWVTEDNLDANSAEANGLPPADLPEMQAKAAMRFFVSFASKGVKAIDLFAASGGSCCQLIPQAFFNAVDANPASYPADLGGLTMQAVSRLTSTLTGTQGLGQPRQLTLGAIAQNGNNSQFTGNGTASFPNLYNRDVLAFLPFQVSRNRFVAAVYVMTSDLTHYYTSNPAPGQTPYDLPAEGYRLTIGNVNAATARVSYYDALTGTQHPASIIARNGTQIVVQLAATDSPRMLTITDGRASTSGAPTPRRSSREVLTLKAPARVRAAAALGRGIPLGISCGGACSVRVMASSARVGVADPAVYGRLRAHPRAGKSAQVTLKLNAAGRAWLRTHGVTRLRITARDGHGATVLKVVNITRAHAG